MKKLKKENFKGISKTSFRTEMDFLTKQQVQILGDLSMVDIKIPLNFSFSKINEDKEFIKNPNVIDKQSLLLENKKINFENNNSDSQNSIYELDENISKKDNLINTPTQTIGLVRRIKATNGTAYKRR